MRTKSVIITGMFAAVLAILSPMAIPLPFGVPLTLQTFAVAMTAFVLGEKRGVTATGIYLLLGATGLPVFAGFAGGTGVLMGMTGGFLVGFLPMAMLCGVSSRQRHLWCRILLSAVGLFCCHLLGVLHFMKVMDTGFAEAVMLSSAPYLIKDAVMMIAAYAVAGTVRRSLRTTGILQQM